MPSTFFGLTIAGSGLNAYQTAVNTTANNISNENTKGYTRQEALMNAAQALRINAKYGSVGTGVEVSKIQQLRNEYYDLKFWSNQAKLGEQQTKTDYLSQMETYFLDDEKTVGFTTIFGDMFNALDKLKTDAASLTTRNSYISSAKTLSNYFNSIYNQLSQLQSEVNDVIGTKVDEINGIAQKIASLNKQINIIEQQGGRANELRDERNLLIDQLSQIVPVEVKEVEVSNSNYPDMYTGATNYTVKINGQVLVSTLEYNQLVCVPRDENNKVNQNDADGLYEIYWTQNSNTKEPSSMKLELNSTTMTGSLKALYDIRDGNNNLAFGGKITAVPESRYDIPYKITISNATIKNINQTNMPEQGTILLGNKYYQYSSYTMKEITDSTGTHYEYEFTLSKEGDGSIIDFGSLQRAYGQRAEIGESVDFMGIPYYQQQLNEFVRSFAKAYNDTFLNAGGVDIHGNPANAFFVANNIVGEGEYSYADHLANTVTRDDGTVVTTYDQSYYYHYLTAANFTVADEVLRDAGLMSTSSLEAWTNGVDAYDIVESLLQLKDQSNIFRNGVASDFLQCLLSDISVDTQKAKIFTKNYENLNSSILNQRMSVSNVDKDEEALNLLKFQNAYDLSSKLVSVLQEMYDRLILYTGA